MKLDTATFAFGYKVKSGGNTPNWATALGQSQVDSYRIKDLEGLNEIIKGCIYCSKPLDTISTKLGRGGNETLGNSVDSPIVLGAVFPSVKVNDVLIPDAKFVLLITRDDSPSHKGRLRLKYGKSNKFTGDNGTYTNEMFFKSARNTLGLTDDACWFVSELTVENQDTLKLKAIIVNKDKSVEYEDIDELHKAWSELEPSLPELTKDESKIIPIQLILYGVPGSGKSYSISKHLEKLGITQKNADTRTKRIVFHPEYTNADFVGQILPQSDSGGEKISYPFVAGPFMQLLAMAYTHKNQHFALIIEEINRGNAAAIFGDLFQLLDRLDKDEGGASNGYEYTTGWSSYPVTNDSINKTIRNLYDEHEKEPSKYPDFDPFIPKENFEKYKENIGIRLPPNFSILATMNTSDQNVFKLDNAFKRRFDLELIPNVFGDENGKLTNEEENQRDAVVEGFDFTWNEFRQAVNKIITFPDNEFDISSFSDRQIGCWFVKAQDRKIPKKIFLNKVLEYLWDDVCGGESTIFFNPAYKSLAELIHAVEKENKTDIFSDDLQEKIRHEKSTSSQNNEKASDDSHIEQNESSRPEI